MIAEGCITPMRPVQPCHIQQPLVFHTETDAEVAEIVTLRPHACIALLRASRRRIASPSLGVPWRSSDITILRRHRLVRKIGVRCDRASLLEITERGRDVLCIISQGWEVA